MKPKEWILGELLFLANSSPPWWKFEFYKIKDKLLTLYGVWEGVHLQHIVKECWDCEGSGKSIREMTVLGELKRWPGDPCLKCNGTGKYIEFWTVLKLCRLGRRRFHTPVGGKYYDLKNVPALEFDQRIEGYIRHETPKYYLSNEAGFWLALIYAPEMFRQRFGNAGFPGRKFTPMVIASTWLFNIRHLPYEIRRRFERLASRIIHFRQDHCWHDFPESDEPSDWDVCSWCGLRRYESAVVGRNNDAYYPF